MGTELITVPGIVNIAAVVALGAFLWRMLGKRFDALETGVNKVDARVNGVEAKIDKVDVSVAKLQAQYEGLKGQVEGLDRKVEGWAKDHQHLVGELAEFRGEMRGRLGAPAPQDAGVT